LRRLLQVAEEEKHELQEMLQAKEELLAKLQKVEKMDVASQTKVYDVSSCSIFSQYETNVGMNILTKMGYRGGGLGIKGQEVTQPLEVEPR
jgi:flagellar biosynthesis/type III secretory pathway chaperone